MLVMRLTFWLHQICGVDTTIGNNIKWCGPKRSTVTWIYQKGHDDSTFPLLQSPGPPSPRWQLTSSSVVEELGYGWGHRRQRALCIVVLIRSASALGLYCQKSFYKRGFFWKAQGQILVCPSLELPTSLSLFRGCEWSQTGVCYLSEWQVHL